MPRIIALAALALATSGCSFAAFEARATQDFVVPAEELTQLVCTSHNGSIRVAATAAATVVTVHVELSVRGDSQAEADARLQQLRVDRQIDHGVLQIAGIAGDGMGAGASPGFAFSIEAPARLAAKLTSHNGAIVATGLSADAILATHNGGITLRGAPPRVEAVTHNGSIEAEVDGDGPLDGNLTSHNGGIALRLGQGRSASIEASSDNGRVRAQRDLAGLQSDGGRLSATAGSGAGRLVLATHNGGVLIR